MTTLYTRAECVGQPWQACERQPPGTVTLQKQWYHDTYLIPTREEGGQVAKHSGNGKIACENKLTSKAVL